MPCDHLGPPEVIEMTEGVLRARGLTAERWDGVTARHGENLPAGAMWASVTVEIARRGEEWIVTRLDRSPDLLPSELTGLDLSIPA